MIRLSVCARLVTVANLSCWLAVANAAKPTVVQRLSEVLLDYDQQQLDIIGQNFGASATASLGGNTLTIVSASSTNIIATMPSVPAGTYELELATTNGSNSFEVTLGAAGPAGPTGPPGPA